MQDDSQKQRRITSILTAAIIILVIAADQWLKIWVKTSFYLGESFEITPWFELKFIENNGMAFGWQLWSKLFLTCGRIAAVGLLLYAIVVLLRKADLKRGFYVALALIVAGAAGNIFDCVFYGQIFNNPYPPQVATLFPPDGGYAPFFEGRVVDMLYFPFFTFTWPDWMPIVGGSEYEFFQYIFNLADSSIFCGVCLLIFWYSREASKAFNVFFRQKTDE